MITLIASDMDGTLLNGKQEVSEENRRAILDAQKKGVEVVVATGRSYEEARYVLQESGITCPIICVNGAEVRNEEGQIMQTNAIDQEKALDVMRILKDLGIYYELYTNEGVYTADYERGIQSIIDIFKTANPETSEQAIRDSAQERFEKGHIKVVDDYSEAFENGNVVYKFLVFSFDDALLAKAKDLLSNAGGLAISASGRENLEVTSENAQKGIALLDMIKEKGMNPEDALAVGDNLNDLSMMKVVGRPVAMGNAAKEILDFCKYKTVSNEEDGVARAIYDAMENKSPVMD
ncbi:HAD family hydrolase [Rossellomorea vietnamensis]|uniref:HAD family hydrolase n=1 Tax=Rossellomorea vietnamensis TaxID=218284 RepID=A0A5D4NWZ1_9BACI|nr:HAD family hydrolase [Rossellomorea vietnamensis]TYS17968.1 HAD family hydrolase [Rossellomorea vietnamensis]